MRAKELFEGRDAPLYHGTSYEAAKSILTSNLLRAQVLPDDDDWDTRDIPVISFSRSLPFAKDFIQRNNKGQGVIFQVDQSKLAQRYKIKPWNYYVNAELSTTARVSGKQTGIFNEYEEFVTRDIPKFDNYLVAIHCYDPNVPVWLKKHPKLVMHVKPKSKTRPKKFGDETHRLDAAKQLHCPENEMFAAQKIGPNYLCLVQDVDDPSEYHVGMLVKNDWNSEFQTRDFNHAKQHFLVTSASRLLKVAQLSG